MKVYVLIGLRDYEGEEIIGIFDSRQKTEAPSKKNRKYYDSICVVQMEVE